MSDDPRFELQSRKQYPEGIVPLGCEKCDLRAVPWEHIDIVNLLGRKNKSELRKMGEAMNAMGLDVILTEFMDTPQMADVIYGEAIELGWTKLTPEQRLSGGLCETIETWQPSDVPGEQGNDPTDPTVHSGSIGYAMPDPVDTDTNATDPTDPNPEQPAPVPVVKARPRKRS